MSGLLTVGNHKLNKSLCHAYALHGTGGLEFPVNVNRHVFKKYGCHGLNLHISIFGRYVGNIQRLVKFMLCHGMNHGTVNKFNPSAFNLHSLFAGGNSAMDVVVLAPRAPDQNRSITVRIGAEEINRDALEDAAHNIVSAAMKYNAKLLQIGSDLIEPFRRCLDNVIHVTDGCLAPTIRAAKLKLMRMLGKNGSDDNLQGSDLLSRESFACGRYGRKIGNLASVPISIGAIVKSLDLKAFLPVPLITLSARLYDCHIAPFVMDNIYYITNMSRNILTYKCLKLWQKLN